MRDYCSERTSSPSEVLEAIRNGGLIIPYTTGLSHRFNELIGHLQELALMSPKGAFDRLFPADQPWAEPFRSIYDEAEGPLDHSDAQQLLLTNITQPELPSRADFVRLMSLHKSKGLTAHHVFVTGCVEGLIPSYPHPGDLSFEAEMRFHEEQRRLFYVAITRARNTLVLSSVRRLPRNIAHRMRALVRGGDFQNVETIASTFLTELGEDCPAAIPGPQWLVLQD